jgi:alpha-tubulin suppressor-like RCC1 family protein
MTSQCAIAVTSDGQLFSWGKSDELILGHPEDQVWLPKQVEAFSKYKVKSFSLAKTHSLVYANKMSKSGKEQD